MPEFGLGAHPSPADTRDYPVASLLAPVPPTLPFRFVSKNPGVVLNQGQTPECVAYSTDGAVRHEIVLGGNGWVGFDEDALYRRAKQLDGIPGAGTNFRTVLGIARNEGLPGPTPPRKIAAYYGVPVDYATIKQVVYQLGEVLIAVDWPRSWFTPNAVGVVPAPDVSAGGHAIRVIGWDDRKLHGGPAAGNLLVRNSWGPGWGMKGSFYLPTAYLAHVYEGWKVTL